METLFDTIIIVDDGYNKSFSLAEFQTYYEWDSVFNPISEINDIYIHGDAVLVSLSTQSNRFEFLENNPLYSKQKISFKGNRIYQFEILENPGVNWNIWSLRRDSLVKWIDKNHPELSGFIFDLTKSGGENYLKAIDLYIKQN